MISRIYDFMAWLPKELPLLLYPLLLLLMASYKAHFSRRADFSPVFMQPEQTRMLQGAACVAIIFHHLTQQITGYGSVSKGPITVFNDIGFLFTALFFFHSGYGLLISLYTKPDYLKQFLRRRLPSVLIPFWGINLLGVMLGRFGYGIRHSLSETLRYIFGIRLLNGNGWFIVEIAFFYLLFYFLFSRIHHKDAALALLCFAVLAVIYYSFMRGHDPTGRNEQWFRGEWWFNSTLSFAAGLLFARFKAGLTAFFQRHYAFLLALSAGLMILTTRFSIFMVRRYGYYHGGSLYGSWYGNQGGNLLRSFYGKHDAGVTYLAQTAACMAFLFFVLLLSMKITLGNRALVCLGEMRLELFLIHGYFVNRIFGAVRMSDFARFGVVTVCSIACSALLSPGMHWLVRKASGVLTSEKIRNRTLESELAEKIRKKRMKILKMAAAAGAVLGVAAALFSTIGRDRMARREYAEECEALSRAAVGEEVFWGRYETDRMRWGRERLPWILVQREGASVWLLSKYGIAGSWYHQKHEAVSWEDSDLRALLASETYLGIFSKYEKEDMIPDEGDWITLLTAAQAEQYFAEDRDRELAITEAARQDGTNINTLSKARGWDMKGYRSSWWWLRGNPGETSVTAPVVTVDGTISLSSKAVNKPGGAVRPLIHIALYSQSRQDLPE